MKNHIFRDHIGPDLPKYYARMMMVVIICACLTIGVGSSAQTPTPKDRSSSPIRQEQGKSSTSAEGAVKGGRSIIRPGPAGTGGSSTTQTDTKTKQRGSSLARQKKGKAPTPLICSPYERQEKSKTVFHRGSNHVKEGKERTRREDKKRTEVSGGKREPKKDSSRGRSKREDS